MRWHEPWQADVREVDAHVEEEWPPAQDCRCQDGQVLSLSMEIISSFPPMSNLKVLLPACYTL